MISGLLVVAVVVLAATAAMVTPTPAATHSNPLPSGASGNNNIISSPPPIRTNDRFSLMQLTAEKGPMKTAAASSSNNNIYTNQFVIQVEGGEEAARKLAHKHGFVYLNHILADYYHLEHRRLAKRSTLEQHEAETLNISIQDEPQVLLLERQVLKRRVKRDFLELNQPAAAYGHYTNQHEQPQSASHQHSGRLPASIASTFATTHTRPPNQAPPARNQQQQQQPLAASRRPPPTQSQSQRQEAYLTRPANQQRLSGAQPLARGPSKAAPHLGGVSPAASGERDEPLETSASSAASIHYQQQQQQSASPGKLLASQSAMQRGNASASVAWQSPQVNSNSSPNSNHNVNLNGIASSIANADTNTNVSLGTGKQLPFNDPSWPLMWYLDGGAKNGFDLNVMAAWKMGYTGKGIVITILDDGLEKDHPDLQANYDPMASFDINGDDADPMPRYDTGDSNRHGTRCAGEVAAVPDNNICSVGIAYNSKVGGVRMLDGDVTDAVEARSLGLNNQHIHIYSASWGPDDNGKTVDGPGELATRAFIEGVTNGRQGLGSIFVFASGNGGREHDNCNCDGYTNSIWTLSISSATENGYVPWYIEACSSTLATTYSSGSYEERQIATTDLHHSCTPNHTGTSASAPLAAGICALVLESNPRLTWRDMQHIVVRTAKPANLVAKDWRTNALGRNVSHAFGYGLMDAAAMITMAKRWTTVPVQYTCEVRSPQMDKFIPPKGYIELKLRAECANVRFLEHVQSKVTLTASRRGDLHIYLVSPHGTRSTLLAQRPNDQAEQGFRNWPFMTVHSWGESPNGIWTLEVHNDGKAQNRAYLKEWTLILYGTYDDPNKHLDSNNMQSIPPPPAIPVASSTAKQQPQLPPKPPGPLPVHPATSGGADTAEDQAGDQMNQHKSTLNSHWSFTPPPPPPPISSGEPKQQLAGSSQRPPSTSTYATTFKTIVSPIPGDRQPPLPSGVTKADFDIVSPATQGSVVPSAPPSTTTEQPPSAQTSSPHLQPQQQPSDSTSEGGELPIVKPSISQIDSAAIGDSSQLPGDNQLKSTTSTTQAPNLLGEVDGNQIDSKLLTKDYRSSGDQSLYEQQQVLDSQINQNRTSSSSSSSAASPTTLHSAQNSILVIKVLSVIFSSLSLLDHFNYHAGLVRHIGDSLSII